MIGQDKPVSDLYAKQIAKDIIVADETEIKARRTLYNRVMRALPANKAVRYLQLEAKIRAVQAYDISAQTHPADQDRAGVAGRGAAAGIPRFFAFSGRTALTSAPFLGEPGPPPAARPAAGAASVAACTARACRMPRRSSHRTILCLETTC